MYGVLVIGAPGAGKSTFCAALGQIFTQLKRPFITINLDPANEVLSYECAHDIKELITVEDAMNKLELGPNGALRYCMQTLVKNSGWLINAIKSHKEEYIVIDCPGQLELYRNEGDFRSLIRNLEVANIRLCAVHMIDSLYCPDPASYISVVMSSLSAMVGLEMPHLNVLSKADLFDPDLPYDLEFYTLLPNLDRLVDVLDETPQVASYRKLNRAIAEVASNMNLVSFVPLDVSSKKDMARVIVFMDKANGFALVEKDLREIVLKDT